MVTNKPECSISRSEHATSEGYEQTFAQTCANAAVHMAQARMSLDRESFNCDQAMTHLDAAISCLQRISRRSPPNLIQAKSTVSAFQPARNRKSA